MKNGMKEIINDVILKIDISIVREYYKFGTDEYNLILDQGLNCIDVSLELFQVLNIGDNFLFNHGFVEKNKSNIELCNEFFEQIEGLLLVVTGRLFDTDGNLTILLNKKVN